MRMKGMSALIMGIVIALFSTFAAWAGTWQKDAKGWWYQNEDGSYARNQWIEDRGKWYFFNSKGYMLSDTTTPDGYRVGSDGALIDETEQASASGQTIKGVTIVPTGCRIESYKYSKSYDRKLVMSYKITNASDSPYGYAFVGWNAALADGTSLKNWADIQDMKLKQVSSKSSKNADVSFLIPKGTSVTEITASYNFMDYDKWFWKDYNALNEGNLSQKEYLDKYCGKEAMTFSVKVN